MARAPVTWPLLRGWSHRFWQDAAPTWDQRVQRSGPDYLAPLAAALLHVRPEPERALDIGTGLGDGALLIAREFPHARVRGVDLSEEMVRRAQARIGLDPEGRVAFKVADASHLPFEDDSFDLVAQLNVPPFFSEIARVLRPGGFVVIAASWGASTPFYTPDSVLTARLPQARHRAPRRPMRRRRAPTSSRTGPTGRPTRFTGSTRTAPTFCWSTRTRPAGGR